MRTIASLLLLASGAVLAGEKTPVYEKAPMMPPAPSLYEWFAGGTVGYLLDNEEEMYTGHFGVDLPNQLAGFDQAIYLEVGYTELSDCVEDENFDNKAPAGGESSPRFRKLCIDLEIIPITLNYKLEKAITGSLNWYLGAGAGVAMIDAEFEATGFTTESDSDDDTVFYAQAFTGLLYNVNPSFELFGGVRYIYFDEPSFSADGSSVDFSDLEDAGFEFENDDVLVEVGGRVNF